MQEKFSGDRDELLPPPMNGQSGNSAGVETLRDEGVAPKDKVPQIPRSEARFDGSLMCASATYLVGPVA
jgi:hypothetical protein